MAKEKTYRSEAMAAVHQLMEGAYSAGGIDKKTMRDFDEACLAPIPKYEPESIRDLRERERVSQKVFATYLNVPVTLVSQWERGERKPSGAALKLLSLVDRHGLEAVA